METCGFSPNVINQMSDKNGLYSFSLAKIADCLDCSVDYLLGRTDTPEVNSCTSINQSNVNSDNSTVNVNTAAIDKDTLELINMIQKLSIVQRAEIILKINEMLEND